MDFFFLSCAVDFTVFEVAQWILLCLRLCSGFYCARSCAVDFTVFEGVSVILLCLRLSM